MESERWQRIERLFDEVADAPEATRELTLTQAAEGPEGDPDAVAQVRAMLRADQEIGDDADKQRFVQAAVEGASTLVAEDDERAKPGRTFGKYELRQRIGEGGFGLIHEGWDPVLERPVAIKTCPAADRNLRKRFFREAQIAARLQHPNIVTIFDFGVEDGIPYLVQELLDGDDLDRMIANGEPAALAGRIDLLRQIARGLSYAHRNGVLHRDVKPGNIRILPNGRVKILDFGIARLVDDAAGTTTRAALTLQDSTMGTIGYLAPEQLSGTEVDRRADLFAFGVVAYEVLSGHRPFDGETFQQTSYRLLFERHPPLVDSVPGCPAVLTRLVDRCLAKKARHRPNDFEAVLVDLEASLSPGATTARSARRRRRWVTIGATLGAVALVVGLQMGARPGDGPRRSTAPIIAVERGEFPDEPPPPPREEKPAENDTAPERTSAQPPPESSEPPATAQERPERPREDASPPATRRPSRDRPTTTSPTSPREAEDDATEDDAAQGDEATNDDEKPAPRMLQPGPGVVAPSIVEKPQPEYPTRAWRRRIEADLLVAVLVGEDGSVIHAVVKNDPVPGYDFGRAALDAARRATFEPAHEGGVAGRMWLELTYTFRRN